MATQAGGTVLVDSTVGKGSTFTILAPLSQQMPPLPRNKKSANRDVKQGVVLVAEDDRAVLDYLKLILSDQGLEVLAALGGEAALKAGQENIERINILISDVVMPDLKGTELAARLRALKPSLKVVYITGYPDSMDAADVPSHSLARPDTILSKPINPEKLLTELRGLLADR
jgi:CheY-like chemotaxis protein